MIQTTTRRETLLAVLGLLLALFLVSLDQTVVGTALPRVIADLRGFELYAWVTTAYLLAQTTVIPIVGKLGDLYGRKWLTVAGVAIFLAGSWLCGFSQNMLWLIAARAVQGIGAGTIMSTVFTLIADVFPDPGQRARYQGFFFAVFALSSVIGPLIGGAITETLGWRWVFYVNVPLGVLSLATLPFVLPTRRGKGAKRIDWIGAVTITVSVIALLLALTWVGDGAAWSDPGVVSGLLIALVTFTVFVWFERRNPEPILPFELFRNRVITTATAIGFLGMAGMFGVVLYLPLFLQGVSGTSPAASGVVLLPLVLTMTAMSFVGGQLMARVGRVRPFMLAGAVLMTIGTVLLNTLNVSTGMFAIMFYLFVMALGLGLLMPNTTIAVQSAAPPDQMGVATAATQFVRLVGATVGTAVIGTLVTSGYQETLNATLPPSVPSALVTILQHPDALVSPAALDALTRAANAVPNGTAALNLVLETARVALAVGIQHGLILVALGSALIIVVAWLIPNTYFSQHVSPAALAADEFAVVPGE